MKLKPIRLTSQIILVLLILAASLLSCDFGQDTTIPTVAPEVLGEYQALKIILTQAGMYRLKLTDLGWDENAIDRISLTHKGQPIPYWIQSRSTGNHLVFYGQPSSSLYTPKNIYIIQQNPDLAYVMEVQSLTEPSGSAVNYLINTVRAEENLIYAPKVEKGSPWHWSKVVAPNSQTIEVDLPGATGGPGNLRVAMWGATTAPTSPAHHIRVSINGQDISETAWDGQIWHTLEADIPSGILTNGVNEVRVQATGEVEALIDIVNLDWIEIDYQKNGEQIASQEFFRTPEEAVQLTNFEKPLHIFNISEPSEISRYELPTKEIDFLIFQGKPELHYLVVSNNAYLQPDQILPMILTPDLRAVDQAESGATYLAIGHPDLLTPLKPLLEYRTEQGLDTLAISIQAIYDQFNHGLAEPQAIQNFLRYAVGNWKTPPEYVLLVGDASYDFYGYQDLPENNFIPPFMVGTVFGGETSSDVLIAQIDDDDWPDLAIGRLPARTTRQVESFVKKTLNFEQNVTTADWNKSILAIADGEEPSFQVDADRFIKQIPAPYDTYLIAPQAGDQGTNQLIAEQFNIGLLLTAYFGHGSINMWGKDSLFTTQDSAGLDNADRLSIILNFTCLTGLFTHPTEQSLAESLLLNPNGGAVAVLAPSSPTLPKDQTFLSDAFVQAMFQESISRLGDVTLFAWRQVPTTSKSSVDVMQTFLLFGDPALQLPTP
jgi:hypothetical protein